MPSFVIMLHRRTHLEGLDWTWDLIYNLQLYGKFKTYLSSFDYQSLKTEKEIISSSYYYIYKANFWPTLFLSPWLLVTRNLDATSLPFFIPEVPLWVWRNTHSLPAVNTFEHSSLVYNIVCPPLAFGVMIEVLAILILVDGSSLLLLFGWFVLTKILCPLGSSSSGGPEGDGARAARMGNEGIITLFPASQCQN